MPTLKEKNMGLDVHLNLASPNPEALSVMPILHFPNLTDHCLPFLETLVQRVWDNRAQEFIFQPAS